MDSQDLTNRLTGETSPYLAQHADNPVHWQPWDEAAWAAAREVGKPVLLSIGYSACHWCHVMAHESFEDPATAAVMNELFVNIKVDREERPDIDRIYQLAHQMLTQNTGGWPLTVFCDPQSQQAFYAGTYFPKDPRFGLPGFSDLLRRVATSFVEQRDALDAQNDKLATLLASLNDPIDAEPGVDALEQARDSLVAAHDSRWGGFGQAPKFPNTPAISRLLRHWAYARRNGDNDREALDAVMTTLTGMARGGVFDHLGGGWCRYSVDEQWMIPHFEKMLYDNGQLLGVYADALAVGPDALFEGAVRQTVGWLATTMSDASGGLYSAQDADSEGEEGTYYVWRKDRVKRLLNADEYLLVETLYGLDKPANFEGRWNLHRRDSWRSVLERLSLDEEDGRAMLAGARDKLLSERAKRTPPGLDDKCLTAWNALAADGLVRAGAVLGEADWITKACTIVDFLRAELWQSGQLHAIWQRGQSRQPAFLDDYACLLTAIVSLLGARWRGVDADFARQLADALLANFEDQEHGGFYFTANDAEALMHRPKPTADDALPSGNGLAASALLHLGYLFGEPRYLRAAERTLAWGDGMVSRFPAGHSSLCDALEMTQKPPQTVLLRGPVDDMERWRESIPRGYAPWRRVYCIPYDDAGSELPAHLPALVSGDTRAKVTAYVCTGTQCSLPVTDKDAFLAELAD